MGYRHPKNEVFIFKDGITYQECRESECVVGLVHFDPVYPKDRKAALIRDRTVQVDLIPREGGSRSSTA
jgi:hypothetical protein